MIEIASSAAPQLGSLLPLVVRPRRSRSPKDPPADSRFPSLEVFERRPRLGPTASLCKGPASENLHKSSRSHCAGVKWQTLDQHQLAGEGVGYRYAAKRRGARDRLPAWLAMDENRYFAMRKHLGGLAPEQQRRDSVAPMRSHDDKVAAFRSRGIDDRLVGTIILDLLYIAPSLLVHVVKQLKILDEEDGATRKRISDAVA